MSSTLTLLRRHQSLLKSCDRCPGMIGPVVTGRAMLSPVMLIGQAPGIKEDEFGRPFAWTAGKTLFKWFESLGIKEGEFRGSVYMAAVCRCFPGKNPKGGDRVPNQEEVQNCRQWLNREIDLLKPQLIIPVGKLAISQFLDFKKLNEVIGHEHEVEINGQWCDLIPLPHPSGASTWHRMEPGKTLLSAALDLISRHPAFRQLHEGL